MPRGKPRFSAMARGMRFMRSIEIGSGDDPCWNWTGSKDRDGYGYFFMRGLSRKAHRSAWHIFVGRITKEQFVLHKCDNTSCVRPHHLFIGTQAENRQDCVTKKRHMYGENHYKAKVTRAQVDEIRKEYAQGISCGEIASRRGLTWVLVDGIIKRRSWKD